MTSPPSVASAVTAATRSECQRNLQNRGAASGPVCRREVAAARARRAAATTTPSGYREETAHNHSGSAYEPKQTVCLAPVADPVFVHGLLRVDAAALRARSASGGTFDLSRANVDQRLSPVDGPDRSRTNCAR